MADLINIVVCAEQTEIKVNIKNKIDPETKIDCSSCKRTNRT